MTKVYIKANIANISVYIVNIVMILFKVKYDAPASCMGWIRWMSSALWNMSVDYTDYMWLHALHDILLYYMSVTVYIIRYMSPGVYVYNTLYETIILEFPRNWKFKFVITTLSIDFAMLYLLFAWKIYRWILYYK